MKSIVVYDSQFGNTKLIAEAIGRALELIGRVFVMHASDVQPGDLMGINRLIVGSPTQQLSATPAVLNWIKTIPRDGLRGVRAAAFDTRFTEEKINQTKVLPFFVRIFGYGAKPISDRLEKKGAEIVLPPEGFYVADTEGPLLERELERAAEWIRKM
ncbi:MAG: flavodoxin family protein [Anaerolineales bacterium]|nr:flavodoxin family protein [Anaerolineales bacterium]